MTNRSYLDTRFMIECKGYEGSAGTSWPEYIKAAYDDEIRTLFAELGWILTEPTSNCSAARVEKGENNLYLQPRIFSGFCEIAERERLFESFKNAKTFVCTGADIYDEFPDMSDNELVSLLKTNGWSSNQNDLKLIRHNGIIYALQRLTVP